MTGVHANRCSSGRGVKTLPACHLQGYHDPDTLFYCGSGALNREGHWISVTFSCLTHLLHLNYSVNETSQHQSRRYGPTRDTRTLPLRFLGLIRLCVHRGVWKWAKAGNYTPLIHCISICINGQLSHNWHRITGHISADLRGQRSFLLFSGVLKHSWTLVLLDWAAGRVTLTCLTECDMRNMKNPCSR